ncbi:MAG: hypothetical protein PHT40_01375 [Patescibacteria group bacterium]|nr:hypothetical protein [Patescibacteria group bacterium]
MDQKTREAFMLLEAFHDVRGGYPERKGEKIDVSKQTNDQVLAMEQFKTFCSEKGIIPSKTQAKKHRGEFIEWFNKGRQ